MGHFFCLLMPCRFKNVVKCVLFFMMVLQWQIMLFDPSSKFSISFWNVSGNWSMNQIPTFVSISRWQKTLQKKWKNGYNELPKHICRQLINRGNTEGPFLGKAFLFEEKTYNNNSLNLCQIYWWWTFLTINKYKPH